MPRITYYIIGVHGFLQETLKLFWHEFRVYPGQLRWVQRQVKVLKSFIRYMQWIYVHSSRRPCSKAEIPLSLPTCVMYWETNPTARNIHPIRQSLDKWSGWSVQKRQISIQDHYVILMTIDRSMHWSIAHYYSPDDCEQLWHLQCALDLNYWTAYLMARWSAGPLFQTVTICQ